MKKFKVLKENQTFLNRIGISLDHSANSTCCFFTFFANYHSPIAQIVAFILSAAFILKYPNEIKLALSTLKVCVSLIQCAGMFFGIRMKVMKTKALQNELQQIVNNGISIVSLSKHFFVDSDVSKIENSSIARCFPTFYIIRSFSGDKLTRIYKSSHISP